MASQEHVPTNNEECILSAHKFTLGDTVTWTSQSAGVAKTKIGTVEQVVAPKTYPDRDRFLQLYRGPGVGLARDHESYVILVPGKTGKGAGKIYWPRANVLALTK